MFCLRTGGMLNKPLISLTRTHSRPALRRFERHVSTLSLMIEQAPPDKRIGAPAVSCQSGFAWSTKAERPLPLSPVPAQYYQKPVVHAATGVEALTASAGLQVLLVLVQRRGRVLAPTSCKARRASDDPMLGTSLFDRSNTGRD